MTLEEAIKHAEEVMIENLKKTKDRNASDPIAINCFECAEEHRQIAEWLKDYKRLLEQNPCDDAISRQAVDEIKELMTDINGDTIYAVRMSDIRQLPSVNPTSNVSIQITEREKYGRFN